MPDDLPIIAVIVPVRNEAARIGQLLEGLRSLREQVLLVDGGSTDGTAGICKQAGFQVITSAAGRARQMIRGVRQARADCYWFLHADCIPSGRATEQIALACQRGFSWGWFTVRLSDGRFIFRVIENLMNWRSRLTRVATGDQGIFVMRSLYEEVGGFPDIPLMEDIAICKRLKRHGRGACIRTPLIVSARRWQSGGVIRTILLMWWLRLRYIMGADPADLHRAYYG